MPRPCASVTRASSFMLSLECCSVLDGEVSQDCGGRGPALWAWRPALCTELLEALAPRAAVPATPSQPASVWPEAMGSLSRSGLFTMQREVGIPSFRTAQRSLFSG